MKDFDNWFEGQGKEKWPAYPMEGLYTWAYCTGCGKREVALVSHFEGHWAKINEDGSGLCGGSPYCMP